jgi:hypothetical protein
LVSPVYFGDNVIWLIPPDQKVDANAITNVSFEKDATKDRFASALLYKLQKRRHLESNTDNAATEGKSTSYQLLVMWGTRNKYKPSARVLLIEHSNAITLDEDILKKLHIMYLPRLMDDKFVRDTWLLDDTTVLVTTLEWGIYNAFEITISKGGMEYSSMKPLWVSSSIYHC